MLMYSVDWEFRKSTAQRAYLCLTMPEISAEKTQRLEVTRRPGWESCKNSPTHRSRQ